MEEIGSAGTPWDRWEDTETTGQFVEGWPGELLELQLAAWYGICEFEESVVVRGAWCNNLSEGWLGFTILLDLIECGERELPFLLGSSESQGK